MRPGIMGVLAAAAVLASAGDAGPDPSPLPPPRQPKPPEDEALAAAYRDERIRRKLLNQRRRLPKGHPDRVE